MAGMDADGEQKLGRSRSTKNSTKFAIKFPTKIARFRLRLAGAGADDAGADDYTELSVDGS